MVGSKLISPRNIMRAFDAGQTLLPIIAKLIADMGANSKARADLEELRRKISELDSNREAETLAFQDATERRVAALFWTLGITTVLAFVAGLLLTYFSFRFQLIKLG